MSQEKEKEEDNFLFNMGYQPASNPKAGCFILLLALAITIGLMCWLC